MYCPSCGSEERQLSQYCRACGTDLRIVRGALERPDAITASAVSAREQIGMAVPSCVRNSPARTNELDAAIQSPASITEHTTHHLTTSKT